MQAFRQMVQSKHIVRMFKVFTDLSKCIRKIILVTICLQFLSLLCDEENLTTWMKESWKKIYDESFVNNTLLAPILGFLPELMKFVNNMERIIANDEKRFSDDECDGRSGKQNHTGN